MTHKKLLKYFNAVNEFYVDAPSRTMMSEYSEWSDATVVDLLENPTKRNAINELEMFLDNLADAKERIEHNELLTIIEQYEKERGY